MVLELKGPPWPEKIFDGFLMQDDVKLPSLKATRTRGIARQQEGMVNQKLHNLTKNQLEMTLTISQCLA